jgi:hypothetical protein
MTTPNGILVPHDNFEVVYDMALCYAALQHYEKAAQLLEQLMNAVPLQYRGKLMLLMGMIKAGTQHGRNHSYSDELDEDTDREYTGPDEEVVELDVFSEDVSPYSHFPPLILDIPNRSPMVKIYVESENWLLAAQALPSSSRFRH